MNISYSRVSSYMSCPYGHYLGYELGVKAKKPQRPLYFGTDFHRLLELRKDKKALKQAKAEIEDTYYSIPPHWQSELGETYLEDLFSIFSDYCKVYADAPVPNVTEQEFELPMFEYKGEPYMFKGKIDELYKRKNRSTGERFLKVGEHKTFTRRPDNNTLVMNIQKNLYAKAVQLLYGILPKTVIWDYIHSKPAPQPVWLEKSKRFSNAKNQQITPYSWLRACKEQGIKDEETLAKAEEFRGNIPNFFFRVEQDYDPEMVEDTWKGFVFQARLIAKYGHKNKTKNMGRNCAFCGYRDICYTQLTGGNLEHLMERTFTIEPRPDIVNEERRAYDPFFTEWYEEHVEEPF